MKPKQICIIPLPCLFICATLQLSAQKTVSIPGTSFQPVEIESSKKEYKQNFIKLNLTAIAFKNYSIQYERVLNKAISVAVSFRTMPATTLPFKSLILDAVGDNADTKKVIEDFRLSNFAFTPEVRFYPGKKGYGRGFYIAPFYRYASFSTNSLTFDFQNTAGVQSSINLSGKLNANTAGLLFGAQWALGKHMCLDWWILGPHYGAGTGDFTGVASKPLTPDEQNDLRRELENLEIPLTNKTVAVDANGASLKLSGPWGGVRSGISLGVRF